MKEEIKSLVEEKKFRNLKELLANMQVVDIADNIKERISDDSGLLITRHRYREALKNTAIYLNQFNLNKEIELSAEDIRLATREIGKITGFIEVDEILDKIFSSFCIGK